MVGSTVIEVLIWIAAGLIATAGASLCLPLSRTTVDTTDRTNSDRVVQFNRALYGQLQLRLEDAKQAAQREATRRRRYKLAASAVKFAEYIIGVTLASAFVEESLSRKAIGALGLLVLVSSLIRHGYEPDASARKAAARLNRLRGIIRQVEDQLPTLAKADDDALSGATSRLSAELSASDSIEDGST